MYTDEAARRRLRRLLPRWYRTAGRDLPWRHTRDPYAVLVSEVMLQQTQVSRVLPAYAAFLRRFPTLRRLARAPLADVLRIWSGLGYNRRARDLHRIARAHPDGLPRDVGGLDALPGVGAYTAAAVACFTTRARHAFADTNIRRVLGRVVLGRIATESEAVAIDRELVPRDAAGWHHALMDLGATICLSRAPRCPACPLVHACRSVGRAAVPVPRRQTAFATSTRRLRGTALRRVLEGRGGAPRALIERELADPRARRVVDGLIADGLLTERSGRLRPPR